MRHCYPGKCVWIAKDSHHRLMYIKPPSVSKRGRYYTPKYSGKFDDWAKKTLGHEWFNLLEQHQLKDSGFSCGALVIWNRHFKQAAHLLSSSKIIFPTEQGLMHAHENLSATRDRRLQYPNLQHVRGHTKFFKPRCAHDRLLPGSCWLVVTVEKPFRVAINGKDLPGNFRCLSGGQE